MRQVIPAKTTTYRDCPGKGRRRGHNNPTIERLKSTRWARWGRRQPVSLHKSNGGTEDGRVDGVYWRGPGRGDSRCTGFTGGTEKRRNGGWMGAWRSGSPRRQPPVTGLTGRDGETEERRVDWGCWGARARPGGSRLSRPLTGRDGGREGVSGWRRRPERAGADWPRVGPPAAGRRANGHRAASANRPDISAACRHGPVPIRPRVRAVPTPQRDSLPCSVLSVSPVAR